jgi:hypothetical protein
VLRYSSPSGPIAVTCVTYSPDFAQWEMGRVARENDHSAGRIGFQLTCVEFITQSDIKDTGNHGIDSILWVLVRHQLHAVGRFDPDCIGAGLQGLTHDDGQPDRRWERRERFPIDIFGQDGFENLPPELVRLDFAMLSTVCGDGFLRHTNLLNLPELRIASGAGLARDLVQVVSESIFDIARLVEAARQQRFDPLLGGRLVFVHGSSAYETGIVWESVPPEQPIDHKANVVRLFTLTGAMACGGHLRIIV